jgi:hypothetical protein
MIVGFVVAVASPVERNFNRRSDTDGYPLSWYPMFSGRRSDTLRVNYMYGLGAEGKRYKIRYNYWARGGFNQGRSQLAKALRKGRKATMAKCEAVAARLAKRKRGWPSRVQTVRVAKGRYDVNEFFVKGNREPMREIVKAECPVLRPEVVEEVAQ